MVMDGASDLDDIILLGSQQTLRRLCFCAESKSRRFNAYITGHKMSHSREGSQRP